MALSYRQVSDLYGALKRSGATSATLPDWASEMNALSGTDIYSQGLQSNWIKEGSVGLDRLLEQTGLPQAGRELGQNYGAVFGAPETGAAVGEKLARGTVNFAPMLVPGPGWAATAARFGLTGLLTGAETYAETGSPAAGLLSGATAVAMPAVANQAEQLALRSMGGRLVSGPLAENGAVTAINRLFPKTIGQGVASQAAGQAAGAGLGELSSMLQSGLDPNQDYHFDPKAALINMTLGQAPFAGIYLTKHGRATLGGEETNRQANALEQGINLTRQNIELKAAQEALRNKTGIESVPEAPRVAPLTPEVETEINTTLSRLRGEQKRVLSDPNLSPEEKVSALAPLVQADAEASGRRTTPGSDTVLGAVPDAAAGRVGVVGKELRNDKKSRTILVADDPGNPEELRGKVVNYSKGRFETMPQEVPETGDYHMFGLPQGWFEVLPDRGVVAAKPKSVDPLQPDLPEQPTPSNEIFHYEQALAEAHNQFEAAQTPAELQSAVLKLRAVQEVAGFPLTDDVKLAKRMEQLTKSGMKPEKVGQAAALAESNRTRRQLAALQRVEQRMSDIRVGDEFRAEQEGLAATDAAVQDELNQLHALEETVGASRSQYADALLSGELNRMYHDWSQSGRKGGFEAFATKVTDSLKTGKDLVKAKVSDETLAKLDDSPEQAPLNEQVMEHVVPVLDSPAAAAAYNAWPRKAETTWTNEKATFVALVDAHALNDVARAEEIFQDREGMDEVEARDEAADFMKRPHVQQWMQEVRDGLRPGTNLLGSAVPRWEPENDVERQILSEVKPERGGHGLREYLEQSSDPVIKALAKDLSRFGETLSRVNVRLGEIAGEGWARSASDRTTSIDLNPAVFYGERQRAEQVVAHELLHGLTLAELDNPTNAKLVTELDGLRQRLAERLPKDLKSNYDNAIASDWMARYDGSSDALRELGPTWDEQNLVYGLLNSKELVSQGFSSKPMQDFMAKHKADGGASFYSRFKNFVKRLLGFSEGNTAFDEFLSKTDALLQQGEWVSSFANFGERYFEGQGLSRSLARAQTKRALGIVMDSARGTNRDLLLGTLDIPSSVRTPEMARAERQLDLMLKEKGEDFQNLAAVMDEQGLVPEQRGLDELAQEVAAGRIDKDVFDLLPPAASKYLFEKVSDMAQVADMIRAASVEKNNGLVNLADPKGLREPVKQALRALDRVLDAERFQEEAVRNLQGLFAVSPDGVYDQAVGDVSRIPTWIKDTVEDTKDGATGFGSWVKNFLQPIGQRARENPETAEAYSRGWQLQANARKMASEGMKPFGLDLNSDTGTLSHDSVQRSVAALKNPKTQKAADKWIWLNQREGRKSGETQLLPASHPDVAAALRGLTDAERNDVVDIVSKQSTSTQVTNAEQLEKMLQIASTRGAIIANADNGLTTRQNVVVADTLLRSIMDLNDPAKAALAEQRIAAVQGKVSPEAFLELLKFSETEIGKYRAWEEFFKKNPAYATGQRLGKYLVEFRKNGRPYLLQAMTKSEARRLAEGGTATKITENYKGSEDAFPTLGPDAVGLLTRIRELEESQLQILSGRLSPEQIAAIRQTSPAAQLATEATYRGGIPSVGAPPRNLTKGAEELPWLENHITWVHKTANYWSRQLFRAQMDAHLLEKEIVDRPDLQKELRTHAENMLHPDSPTAQKITRFASTWFMGFNAATALVNMAQPFTTHVAEMTSMTGKPLDSYRRTLNALKEIAGERVGGKDWATEEHSWLMKKAAQDGEIDSSMFDDEAAAQESVATNYKRAIQLNRPQTLGQRLSTLSGNYSTVAFWLFKQGERVNNEAALLSSYDYHREQGLSREEAYAKATEFNHAVNFGGGRAQRPVGAFSGRGSFPRSAAQLATSLQSYVLGTTFQLVRYLQKGLFRPTGLAPSEVFAARKAAVQMLGTQLAAAGVLGLPFVSGAIALLDKAFPDLELNKNLRGLMSSLFGEDEGDGNTLTDMAMTGVPSMLGWDLQSRLSMGNTVPGVSEVNGFQPELLAGPAVNLVSRFIGGGQKLTQGDASGAADLLPNPIKNALEAVKATVGGPLTDYRNRPLFQATPGEALGKAVGFQPKRLSDFNASQRILRQSEDNASRRSAKERQEFAEQVLKGNFGTIRQQLLAKAQADKTYNPVEEARGIVRAAEELTFPRDLRREGSSSTATSRNRLLSSFGINPQGASEVARLQFRLSVEQKLGVPQSDRRAELVLAQTMDQLKQQNPSLSRVELRRLAEAAVRRKSASPTLLEPAA